MTPENLRPMALATAILATAVLAVPAAAAGRAEALWANADAEPHADDKEADAEADRKAPSGSPLFDPAKSSETTGLLGHSLAAVLVILVLGAAAVFVVKRLLPRLGISQGKRINVLETVYLGPRKSLHVVRVGDRTLLVSGTRERLGLLADVTDAVPAPEEPAPAPARKPPASRFRIPEAAPENV